MFHGNFGNNVIRVKHDVIRDGLQLYFNPALEESWTKSGYISDLSGNNYDGQLVSPVSSRISGNFKDYTIGGQWSLICNPIRHIQNTANTGKIIVTNPVKLQSQNFTISFWMYPRYEFIPSVVSTIFDYDHATTGSLQGWVIQSEDAQFKGYYYLAYYDGSAFRPSDIGAGKGIRITPDWQMLTYVKQGATVTGYLNNRFIYKSSAPSSTIFYTGTKNLQIYNCIAVTNRQTSHYLGIISIYSRGLSYEEVYSNYQNTKQYYAIENNAKWYQG